MSVRDLIARMGTTPKRHATPAQAHVRMCLDAGREAVRTGSDPEGWKLLGSGYFSAVYEADSVTAVKVGSSLDGGYVFAMWALQNQHLEGVPRIYAVQRVSVPARAYVKAHESYVVVMERLDSPEKDDWGSLRGASRAQYNQMMYARSVDVLPDHEHEGEECAAFIAMRELRHYMVKASKCQDPYFDLHSGNVMMRGDVLVLIDPLAGLGDVKDRGKYARKRYEKVLRSCSDY